MTQRKKIIASCLAVALLYIAGYIVCRSQGELIHRKTLAGGWKRHWVKPGNPEPSVQPLPFAPIHIPGNDEYNAAMEQFRREFKAISTRRRVLGAFFVPLRCVESMAWWIVDAKD